MTNYIENIGKNHLNNLAFYQFKMLGNIISMMWQSMKSFHQSKVDMLRSLRQNDEYICLSLDDRLPW